MYRHVSIFTLKDLSEIDHFIELLKRVEEEPTVIYNSVGKNFGVGPENGPGPQFGDVIQIVDFKTKEDLDAYPMCKAHMRLIKEGPEMANVAACDYEI